MSFTRTRGRPRKAPEEQGATPQLLEHQRQGRLREPLDALLWHGVIDAEQHRAGLRLRHLRAVTFGVAAPSAAFHWLPQGNKCEPLSDRLRESLSTEYKRVQKSLAQQGCWLLVAHWSFAESGALIRQDGHLHAQSRAINQAFANLLKTMTDKALRIVTVS